MTRIKLTKEQLQALADSIGPDTPERLAKSEKVAADLQAASDRLKSQLADAHYPIAKISLDQIEMIGDALGLVPEEIDRMTAAGLAERAARFARGEIARREWLKRIHGEKHPALTGKPAAEKPQASQTDRDRWAFAEPMRSKEPPVSWKTVAELWTNKTGEPVDEQAMKQSCHRAKKADSGET